MIIGSHHTPKTVCPFCGEVLDMATGFGSKSPKPGDISVCVQCHSWLRFTEDLTLRPFEEADLKDVDPETLKLLKMMTLSLDPEEGHHD